MTRSFDLLCMGRSTLDLFGNQIGKPFAEQKSFNAYVGGCPTNICVGAKRLGLKTALFTGVGDDYVSGFLLKFLQAEGVDTQNVIFKPGKQTNTVAVALQPPDEMQFVPYHSNNADLALDIEDVLRAPLLESRALLFSGMNLVAEPSRSATQFAAIRAREGGGKVFMDLDYRVPMWPSPYVYSTTARVTLPLVDIAIGTEDEVLAASGRDDPDEAITLLLGLVNEALVVKKGADGSTVYPKEGNKRNIKPFPVEVVNFLGAGDAFAGGFIYGYLNDWSLRKSARLGNACGAMVVSQHGTANDMPTLDAALQFVEANGGF